MILLDTNVLSEPIRKRPDTRVTIWLDTTDQESLFLRTPVLAEVRAGIERLPQSNNRHYLERWYGELEQHLFVDRILLFDISAVHEFGRIIARRHRAGRPIQPMDSLIAAIALANGMALATRDTGDFAGLGLDLINPFADAAPTT